ncbi:hypothetical protein RchiOBHm_Chr4g0424791 [Rosa chinensis]|uniref:Uncharacterized protein n=1 Tax=Rosa chinensis TaxID=74649 RepID=A0A2P6QYX9_ROSCH|nr:hypothetical protein RchiOBHm_Chr4g0424791 [Rosa chinensis]
MIMLVCYITTLLCFSFSYFLLHLVTIEIYRGESHLSHNATRVKRCVGLDFISIV